MHGCRDVPAGPFVHSRQFFRRLQTSSLQRLRSSHRFWLNLGADPRRLSDSSQHFEFRLATYLFDQCSDRASHGGGRLASTKRIAVRKTSPAGSGGAGYLVARPFPIFSAFHGRKTRCLARLGLDAPPTPLPLVSRSFPRSHPFNSH